MISAQQAVLLSHTWVKLEQQFGGQAVTFLRQIVAPEIEAAARGGKNFTSIDGCDSTIPQGLTLALAHLGYHAQPDGRILKIRW